MIILYMYLMYSSLMSILSFSQSLYLMIFKFILMMEMEFINLNSMNFEFLMLLDWMSMLFMGIVLFISFMVYFYSSEYMLLEMFFNRFLYMILLFVIFMILLIISPNFLSILFGWDGLGLISYCLVVYYQNNNSVNSAMITVLMNRVGDVMILMIICMSVYIGSMNFMDFIDVGYSINFMILIASMTKSAQIPFSLWLPKAMAAPTPVSSLVHSSTLVTAGVYLLIRFNFLMSEKLSLLKIMMFISIITMFMAGVGANFEVDLKKIIALSTLSQLGVMFFCLSLNLSELTFFHLITHAMFKSMLFMCAGVIIHNMKGWQDIRLMNIIYYNMPMISVMFNCSSLSLCGMPFLSGFYSKDLILEMFMMNNMNKFMFIILFFSMGLTVSYSIRMMYYLFLNDSKLNIYKKYIMFNSKMLMSMYMLFMMTMFIGCLLSWLLFSFKNEVILSKMNKLMIYLFMLSGIYLGLKLMEMKLILYKKSLINFTNMWFMFLCYKIMMGQFMYISKCLLYNIENGWQEFLSKKMTYNMLKKLYMMKKIDKNYFNLIVLLKYILLMLMLII